MKNHTNSKIQKRKGLCGNIGNLIGRIISKRIMKDSEIQAQLKVANKALDDLDMTDEEKRKFLGLD